MKNKGVFLIVVIFIVGILSGCSRLALLEFETNRDEKQYREMADKVFAALDSKNKEGLKKLFAPNVIHANANIDKQIDQLLKFYKRPKESDENVEGGCSSESNEYGVKKINLRNDFLVTAGGTKYHVYLALCSRNDKDKGEEGIHTLEFATEEAKQSKYFRWHFEDLGDSPGIYVQTSVKKREDMMMVNANLVKYNPIKRKLCKEDFLNFVKKNDNFDKLIDSVGEANGCDFNRDLYYFELSNNQYIACNVINKKIKYIYEADENQEICTLWLADNMIKVNGTYVTYTSSDRKLNENYFKSFLSKSNSLEKLIGEIGKPDAEEPSYSYYKLPDNKFVVCHCSGDIICSVSVADANNELYKLWQDDKDGNQ